MVIYFQWEKSQYLWNHLWEFGITQNTVESAENRSANLKYRTNLLCHNVNSSFWYAGHTLLCLNQIVTVMFHDNRCVKIVTCYNSVPLVNMLHFVVMQLPLFFLALSASYTSLLWLLRWGHSQYMVYNLYIIILMMSEKNNNSSFSNILHCS